MFCPKNSIIGLLGKCKVWVEQISDPGSSLTPNNVLLLISPKSEIRALLGFRLFIHENVK